ncbi:putative G-protein coupled receptor 162 [Microcaecilia unicolor]|uniref:Probable G-protein coupled receptor 162 n=1 Tax=Microcaecilia unicolor TaxID=1415580 RepID=A0A6P7WWU6_9AMPH|nr:probable G-protein coupled receptor 162 [Microcaecilia unicolor]
MQQSNLENTFHNNSLSWLACGALSLLANAWIILSICAKQQKRKPLELLLCFLSGTHILMAAIPLTMFSVIQLRKEASDYDWNEGICKVFVSTYYTLALATCFTVASLSYHRMWMVRWPVNYRLSNTKKQALHAIMGIWMVSFILSTLPSIGWHDNSERYYARGCQFIVSKIGLGFGVCFSLLLLGGIVMGMFCMTITFYHALCARGRGRRATHNAFTVPTIVVEDAYGKRRSSLDGSESLKMSMQTTNLIGAIVFLYDTLTGLPILVVSFVSLKYNSAPTWMVLSVLWCSMVQTLLLPSFIWSCERYRADVRTVWEQCVAILSEEDADEDCGGCVDYTERRLCEIRFDSNGTTSGNRIPSFTDGHDSKFLLPLKGPMVPGERGHYLQVPLSRRMSHDESDMFSSNRTFPFIQKWPSSDDIRRGSLHRNPGSTMDLLDLQRPRRHKADDSITSLRQFLEAGLRGNPGDAFFFRDEITTFIDETPLPSPVGSPRRSRPQPVPHDERRMSLSTGMEKDHSALRRCSLTDAVTEFQGPRKSHEASPARTRPQYRHPHGPSYRGPRADSRDISPRRTRRDSENPVSLQETSRIQIINLHEI